MARLVARILGVMALLLGGLWLLQGLGLVTIPPILCVAECTPLEGASVGWAVAGFVLAALGTVMLVLGFRRRPDTGP